LKAAGAEKVFSEKVSGALTDHRQLAKAIAALEPGDTLLVCRLDRLARSTRDLLNVLASVSDKSAGFWSLADPMIDTTSPHGKLIIAVVVRGHAIDADDSDLTLPSGHAVRAISDPVRACSGVPADNGSSAR
jgi:Resolvase, N terminal domain